MNIYYWNKKKNFGDALAPLLIKHFCHLDSEWSEIQAADLILCGSILDHVPEWWNGVIAGAGFLHERKTYNLPDAKILAVRGPLSARALKLKGIVYADPGLLANELVPLEDKVYDLGIVAHWTDNDLQNNKIFKPYNPRVIRVDGDPLEVISEIGRCKKIVSSSLHGIILADAFGIPRRIEIPPRALTHAHQEGGLFKWKDYHSSINLPFIVGQTQTPDYNIITDKQHELFQIFEEIKTLFS